MFKPTVFASLLAIAATASTSTASSATRAFTTSGHAKRALLQTGKTMLRKSHAEANDATTIASEQARHLQQTRSVGMETADVNATLEHEIAAFETALLEGLETAGLELDIFKGNDGASYFECKKEITSSNASTVVLK